MWTDQLNVSLLQPFPQRIAVISLVGNQPTRFALGTPCTTTRNSDIVQGFFEERDLRRGRRVQVVSQRNTLAVDHHHPLRALAPLGFPDSLAPFFAGAKLPSAKASLQSNCPRSSSSARKARQIFSHTPCSSQSLSRRQQVEELGYCGGKSLHGAPVRRIQRIPSKTLLLSTHGRPPRRDRFNLGSNTSIFCHCESVNLHRCLATEILLRSTTFYHNYTTKTSPLFKIN